MEEEVKKGTKVEILTREGKNVSGTVEEIGIKKDGRKLMVVLKTGEIGRIVKIIDGKVKTEIEILIKKGESYKIEFKADALWSVLYKSQEINESKSNDLHSYKQKTSKVIIAKSIAAFMNSDGGTLAIGIKEKKSDSKYEVVGIENDLARLKQLEKDTSLDGYKRMIIDEIIRSYFPPKVYNSLSRFISIYFEEFENKIVCLVKINKSDVRIFLNLEGRKIFMIRTDTESRQIVDEELVDYCMERFR